MRYLLGDVPDVSGGVQSHQPVVDCHLVEGGSLLVAKERVRQPDLVPVVLAQTNGKNLGMNRLEGQPPIAPRLAQIHAYRVIL